MTRVRLGNDSVAGSSRGPGPCPFCPPPQGDNFNYLLEEEAS